MNKRLIMFGAVAGMTIGGLLPMLWGDGDMFGLAGILLGMVGGLLGIYLAVYINKRYL